METNLFAIQADDTTRTQLRDLLVLSLALQAQYAKQPVQFGHTHDARVYLNKQKSALCASSEDRARFEREFDRLTRLLMTWSKDGLCPVALRCNRGWAITEEGQLCLPWGELEPLTVKLTSKLLSLVEYSHVRYVELVFEKDQFWIRTHSVQNRSTQVTKSFVKETHAASACKQESVFAEVMRSLNAAFKAVHQHEQAVSKSMSRCQFENLQGRPLSGGLPSLGRR